MIYLSKRAKLNLVNVQVYGFQIDLTHVKQYSDNKHILLNQDALIALKNAENELPKNYLFTITYGYRTLEEQTKIVTQTEKELKQSHPNNYKALLNTYTGGYEELNLTNLSYMNHRSGYAVDLKLTLNSKEIDLGGQNMDKTDSLSYYQTKQNLPKKEQNIKDNRELLRTTLTNNGFENYPKEWWHWGYKV